MRTTRRPRTRRGRQARPVGDGGGRRDGVLLDRRRTGAAGRGLRARRLERRPEDAEQGERRGEGDAAGRGDRGLDDLLGLA
jgi:hypothetical protein